MCKLQQYSQSISADLEALKFSEAYDSLYHFVWDDFADWYIEASKAEPNREVLAYALAAILKLAHPFAPFVTETIWQSLLPSDDAKPSEANDTAAQPLLATSDWPDIKPGDTKVAADFDMVKTAVSEIRLITRALNVRKATLYYQNLGEAKDFFGRNADVIVKLASLEAVVAAPTDVDGLHLTQIPYDSWLDIDRKKQADYVSELKARQTAQKAVIDRLKGRLSNRSYVANAPQQVVAQTEAQLEEARQLLENLSAEADRFSRK